MKRLTTNVPERISTPRDGRQAPGSLIRELAFVLAAAPCLLFPGRWAPVGAALIALGWAARWRATGRLSIRTWLDAPIALLALMSVVGLAVSANPAASASKGWGMLLGFALYYALVNGLGTVRHCLLVAAGLVVAGVAVAVAGVLGTDWSSGRLDALPILDPLYAAMPSVLRNLPGSGVPRVSDLLSPREVGGTLSLLVPVAAAPLLLGAPLRPLQRLGLLAASLLMGFVLLLSQTPSAIAGVGLALWLCLVLGSGRAGRWWLLAGAVAAGLALVGLVPRLGSLLGGAAGVAPQAGDARAAFGFSSRFEIWSRALAMIHDTPYSGVGLNTFPWVMDRFYSGFEIGPEPHAHSLYLQTAIDFGLPGLVALLWLLTAAGLSLLRAYRGTPDRLTRALSLSLGAGLVAYLVFGTIDAVTLGAKPSALLWVALGISAALGRLAGSTCGAGPRALNAVMAALLGAALLVPLAWTAPALNAGRVLAYRALLFGEPDSAALPLLRPVQASLSAAAAADPANSGTWYLLGSVASRLGETERAIDALRRGAAIDGEAPLAHYAPGRRGLAGTSPDWDGLQQVYGQWQVRYPARAEWYVASAIVRCEAQADSAAAQALLETALSHRAVPETLVAAYRAQVGQPGACATRGGLR